MSTQVIVTGSTQVVEVDGDTVTVIDRSVDVVLVGATIGGGGIESVVAGINISVDNTDPLNPVINSLSDRYKTTSSTSQTIVSSGTLTFTVNANLAYTSQQEVIIAYDANNHMHGTVVSYSGTSLVVDIKHKTGSGTYSLWTINLDGTPVDAVSGSGTTNEIAYFTAAQVIASLPTATYPSLTELSYVKGVTSAIQTQLNSKLSGNQTITLSGDVTGSGATGITTTIANNAVTTAKINNDAVTYAKIQNVSATDKLLGRSSAGAGDVEEITCTSFGRSLIDDADAATARTTLGLGTLATQNGTFSGTSSGTNTGDQIITLTGDVTGSGTGSFAASIANDAVTYAKIQNVSATDRLLGRSSAGAGDVEEITCTSFGRSLIDDADAATARTTLGLGTLATQSGTFSGTSSGTNTGDQTITLTGDVTGSGTGSFAATIANDAVTFAKMQNVAANSVLARAANTSGDVSEVSLSASQLLGRGSTGDVAAITLGSGLSMSGTTLSATGGTPKVTVLAQSTTASSVTGTASETTLATYTLPANTLPSNGALRITTLWSRSGSGGTATARGRFGGTGGTQYLNSTMSTTQLSAQNQLMIYANNSTSAQKGRGENADFTSYSRTTVAQTTSSVNTTSNADIVLSGQLANTGDTLTLEGYIIEMLTP